MAIAVPAGYALESGLRDGIIAAARDSNARAIQLGLTAVALNWLLAAAVLGLATHARLVNQARGQPGLLGLHVPGRVAGLARAAGAGFLWGTGLGWAAATG